MPVKTLRNEGGQRQTAEAGALEEGEEDPNVDVVMEEPMGFDLNEKPEEYLGQYEKFSLYLEVVAQSNPDFFAFEGPFSIANSYSIKMLNEQTKSQIIMQLFPLRFRIYLVPRLNVLSIRADNKLFDTEQLLSGLFTGQAGEQLRVKDLQLLNASQSERLYEWLHNWAGLYLEVSQPSRGLPEGPYPHFRPHVSDSQIALSTHHIFKKLWQRMLSRSILNLQVDHFAEKLTFLKDVAEEFKKVKEFLLMSSVKGHIKVFKRAAGETFEMVIEREKGAYEVAAVVKVPINYPQQAPTFHLSMLKWLPSHKASDQLPASIAAKMDALDLKNVNNLGTMQANR